MPAWLPTCLKQCLVTERHHKVLRRLLHLLATIPSNSLSSETGSQPERNNADAAGLQQEGNAQQQTAGNDAHTIASGAAMPDTISTASQVSGATAASPSLSAPAASCSSSSSSSSCPTIASSFTATDGAQPSVAPTAAPAPTSSSSATTDDTQPSAASTAAPAPTTSSAAATDGTQPPAAPTAAALTAAVQQYEQISFVVTRARHPSVKREGLHCLGAAVCSVIAALMPSKPQQHPRHQSQQHSQQDSQQYPQAAVACVSGDQPSDSQHLNQDATAQKLGQTAADSSRREQAGRGNSGSEEAQPRSSLLHDVKVTDSRSDSGLGSDPAHHIDLFTSQNPPQTPGRAQLEHEASSEAQQAQRGDEQTAHHLVDGFVALVSTYSEAQQYDDMRLAAASALAASGSLITCPLMIAWCTLVCPSMVAWFKLACCEATVTVLGERSNACISHQLRRSVYSSTVHGRCYHLTDQLNIVTKGLQAT